MNKKKINIILLIFFLLFLVMGIFLIKTNIPEEKNERVYSLLQKYIPYELEKRIGGFSIVHKQTGHKEQPLSPNVMKRLSLLEQTWGQTHLKLQKNILLILNEQEEIIHKIELNNQSEEDWIMNFFQINKVSTY